MERVADYIIRKLCDAGVRHIFMIAGRGVLFLTDAVAKEERIQGISTYHEQGASYAAMAYARATGGLSACLVSTGCAATNAITAALCAWQDSLPVVFISGQHMLEETTAHTGLRIRTYGSQEADIVRIVKPITKYAVMLENAEDVAEEVEKALFMAQDGRQGPVWIDVPLDIQNMRVEPSEMKHLYSKRTLGQADMDIQGDVRFVAAGMEHAKRPIILIGGGIRSSKAGRVLQDLVERCRIPLVFTSSAADVYGSSHELSIGAAGALGGSRPGNFALQNSDYVLAIGTRLCSQLTGTDYDRFARDAHVVVVDIDAEEHKKKEVRKDRLIVSDARNFLEQLVQENIPSSEESWVQKCLQWKDVFSISKEPFVLDMKEKNQLDLYAFSDAMSEVLPHEATVITDAGFEELIVPSTIRYRDGQQCIFPSAQGAMGFAIPAVLGTYFAGREQIVVVVGDGSIMMNLQELLAIQHHAIPVKIFVIQNDMYAVIRRRQKDLFRRRTIGNDFSDGLAAPDFKRISDCFGFKYRKLEGVDSLVTALTDLMQEEGQIICEVACTPDQPYLHKSYGINEAGRMSYRPLEELSPFLDRDVWVQEMLIPTAD